MTDIEITEIHKTSETNQLNDPEERNPFFEDEEDRAHPKIYEYEAGLEVNSSTHKSPNNRERRVLTPPMRYIDMSRCEQNEWGNVRPLFKFFNINFILGPGWQPISPFIICSIILVIYLSIAYNLSLVNHPRFVDFIIAFGGLGLFGVIFFTAFTDPGFIKRKSNRRIIDKHRDDIYCFRCMVSFAEAKKNNVMHCFDCDRCTKGHDHHCPVLGNCIAANNILTFYAMIAFFAIAVACAYLALYYMIMAESHHGDARKTLTAFAQAAGAPHHILKKVVEHVKKTKGNVYAGYDN